MEFKYSKIDDGYKLEKDYVYRATRLGNFLPHSMDNIRLDADGTLNIYKGYKWDGATGAVDRPKKFFRMGIRKKIIRASCVHDALCDLIANSSLSLSYRHAADKIFRDICREDEMSWTRVQYTYLAIRLFVKLKYGWEY